MSGIAVRLAWSVRIVEVLQGQCQWPERYVLPIAVRKERFERVMRLHERRLDDHVAEVLLDANIAFEQLFDNALVMTDTARHELEQVIVSAAHQMAFDNLVDIADCRHELDEVF